MAFMTEHALTQVAVRSDYIKNICKSPCFIKLELNGLFGIPDLVIANIREANKSITIENSYAFEMKLTNWKQALHQAYRYKSFANSVFVIMDDDHVNAACKNILLFQRANIGLASVKNNGKLIIHFQPELETPFSESIFNKFRAVINHSYQSYSTDTKDDWVL